MVQSWHLSLAFMCSFLQPFCAICLFNHKPLILKLVTRLLLDVKMGSRVVVECSAAGSPGGMALIVACTSLILNLHWLDGSWL